MSSIASHRFVSTQFASELKTFALLRRLAITSLLALGTLMTLTEESHAIIIADTVTDLAGTQGANGFHYGYFDSQTATSGTLHLDNMSFSAGSWRGLGGFSTPLIGATFMHPGNTAPQYAAVRRYTVGAPGEELFNYEKPITISGKFWDGNPNVGDVTAFVTVDDVVQFASSIPNASTDTSGFVSFSISLLVSPGSTIDFGISPNGAYGNDGSNMSAFITAAPPVPEPTSFVLLGLGIFGLMHRRRRASGVNRFQEGEHDTLEIRS